MPAMPVTRQDERVETATSPPAMGEATPRPHPVTWRAVLLGLFGAIHVSVLQVVSKIIPQTVLLPYHSVMTLFAGAIFWLFWVAVANALMRRWRPAWALRPAEFAVIYAITTVAASIAAQDEAQFLIPVFTYPFRETQDQAMGPFRQFIPDWLSVKDPAIVEPYYSGNTSFWTAERLLAWAVPLAVWLVWLSVLGATCWAWNVILRRRWVDQDRLTFPSVQLPLEICRAGGFGGMVGGRMFWGGFWVATAVESLNQLHGKFPAIPALLLDFTATPILEQSPEPWNALAPMYMMWAPIHLGICYLIPLDILFSSWFFYLLRKAMEVYGYAQGWRDLGWDAAGFPYTRAQSAGAWVVLFFLLVWAERRRIGRILAGGFWPRVRMEDDTGEPGSYRWAARILVLGTLFQIGFSMAAGMTWWLALAYNGFFWALYVTMTRIYAQVGPPLLELYYLDPQKMIPTLTGTIGWSPQSATHFSMMYWINRDHRGQPMAHQLSAFYVGGRVGVDMRSLGRWVLIAFVVGAATCLIAYMHWVYRVGEDQFASGGWRESGAPASVSRLTQWTGAPKGPDFTEIGFMLFGGAFTILLAKLSTLFMGFPFHPIGYALAVCFAVEYNWPAFLMMWAVKGLMLRYAGRDLYDRFRPFALGLVCAGLVAPMMWGFVAWLFEWYK